MKALLALCVLGLVLVSSPASAHHHHYAGVRVRDEVYCITFRNDPSGPITDVTFEGRITAIANRADVWAVRVTWRIYDSETLELVEGPYSRWAATDEMHRSATFGVDLHVPPSAAQHLTATVQWKRVGMRDIFHTLEVARYPSGEEEPCQ